MDWMAMLLVALMLLVVFFDLREYRIPNWLTAMVLALYPLHLLLAPQALPWGSGLIIGLAMFAIGYLMFAFRVMGGGDVKLLAVLGLWTGVTGALQFLVLMGIFGGLLSLALLLGRPVVAWAEGKFFKAGETPRLPRLFIVGEPVPYGLAIAIAFLLVLWAGGVPGIPVQWPMLANQLRLF